MRAEPCAKSHFLYISLHTFCCDGRVIVGTLDPVLNADARRSLGRAFPPHRIQPAQAALPHFRIKS